jgi:hypothetical protein
MSGAKPMKTPSRWRAAHLAILLVCAGAAPVVSQQAPFDDAALDALQGRWRLAGRVQGDSVTYNGFGEWVLNHQFLRLNLRDAATPPQYEAHVYIGWDARRKRYAAHWLDVFGGGFAETLGHGTKEGDELRFLFEYPDGPFRTTFVLGKQGWELDMKSRAKDGTWKPFAHYVARR